MGIVNEYHEPTTFNGVERPLFDNKLALLLGVKQAQVFRYHPAGCIRYQAYVVNGFNGYDGTAG
jgi:hypothetical protein